MHSVCPAHHIPLDVIPLIISEINFNYTYMGNHWNTKCHHDNTHPKCELLPVRAQYFWPVVHHTCDE